MGLSGLWSVSDRRHYRTENPKHVWFLRPSDLIVCFKHMLDAAAFLLIDNWITHPDTDSDLYVLCKWQFWLMDRYQNLFLLPSDIQHRLHSFNETLSLCTSTLNDVVSVRNNFMMTARVTLGSVQVSVHHFLHVWLEAQCLLLLCEQAEHQEKFNSHRIPTIR